MKDRAGIAFASLVVSFAFCNDLITFTPLIVGYAKEVIMKAKLSSLVFTVCFLLSFQALAQDNVLRLKAPKEILELWKQWNGKYAMYVHKEAKVKEFKDVDGMVLMVAFIDSNEIFGDAQSFSQKSGIKLMLALQNNPRMYDKQFLEGSGNIGIMVTNIAKHYKFDINNNLLRIEFE